MADDTDERPRHLAIYRGAPIPPPMGRPGWSQGGSGAPPADPNSDPTTDRADARANGDGDGGGGDDGPRIPYYGTSDPDEMAANPGPSAVERGWVVETDVEQEYRRHQARRKLATVEREVQILKLHHRGMDHADIAEAMGVSRGAVGAIIRASIRKTLTHAGAVAERERQLHLLDEVTSRVLEQVLTDFDEETGQRRPANLKAVDSLMKVLNRRAALTGADVPAKMVLEGEVTHRLANETVDKVAEFADLADKLLEFGYGSGRAPEGDVVDAEVIDDRPDPAAIEAPHTPWSVAAQRTDGADLAAPDPEPTSLESVRLLRDE